MLYYTGIYRVKETCKPPVNFLVIKFCENELILETKDDFQYISNFSNKPICSQCIFSLPPENIRKPEGFLMFSEVRERVHWEQMG